MICWASPSIRRRSWLSLSDTLWVVAISLGYPRKIGSQENSERSGFTFPVRAVPTLAVPTFTIIGGSATLRTGREIRLWFFLIRIIFAGLAGRILYPYPGCHIGPWVGAPGDDGIVVDFNLALSLIFEASSFTVLLVGHGRLVLSDSFQFPDCLA